MKGQSTNGGSSRHINRREEQSSPPAEPRPSAFQRHITSRTPRPGQKAHRSLVNLSSNKADPDANVSRSYSPDQDGQNTIETTYLFRQSFAQLHDFQQRGEMCDLDIKLTSKTVCCHRLVMACVSQYFKAMFVSKMGDNTGTNTCVDFSDQLDPKAVEDLVQYAYTSRITINHENAQPVLHAATYLQIDHVSEACSQFMRQQLHPTNVINMRKLAEQNGRSDLLELADNYMMENFNAIVECDDFSTISPQNLADIISNDNLNVESETQVYEAVIRWVKFDAENRKQTLAPLLSKVKLPLLPASYLTQIVEADELIRSDMECRDYLDEAKSHQLALAGVVTAQRPCDRVVPRRSCSGVLFCVGGRGASGDPFRCIECYDFRNDKWFQIADMSTRRRHVGVVCAVGKLFAIGGHDGNEHMNTCETFDPITNRWRFIAPMKTFRRGLAVAALGGALYAIGGLDDSSCFNAMERYDPEADAWSYVSSMNVERGGVGVAVLKNCIYAIGGNDGNSSLNSCEKYDPILNKWILIALMNKRRAGAGVAVLHGLLYAVGGFDDNAPLESTEVYDPELNEWQFVTPMSSPRGGVGVAALGGHLFAVGGHDGSNYLNSVEAYNPIQDSWENRRSLSINRAGAGITSGLFRVAAHSKLDKLKAHYMSVGVL